MTSREAEAQKLNEDDNVGDDNQDLLEKASIIQVIHDEIEDKYLPVVGGYVTGQLDANYTIRFKLVGLYLFKLINHPRDPPPIKIKVSEEQPLLIDITDQGFFPRIVKIGILIVKYSLNIYNIQ